MMRWRLLLGCGKISIGTGAFWSESDEQGKNWDRAKSPCRRQWNPAVVSRKRGL